MTASNRPPRRRRLYGAVGALLALGAPVGLLTLRLVLAGGPWSVGALVHELSSDGTTYVYVAISTLLVFSLFGVVLGVKEDRALEESWTDPLTRVSNRRYLNMRLEEELARARRYETPLSFLLIDVDRLKVINDQGGHDAGDHALVAVAQALEACSRQSDTVARFGGDEFAWLAPFATLSDAAELGQRLRHHLSERGEKVTVSVGVTDFTRVSEKTPKAIYDAADQALYEAKRAGRDRVVESVRTPPIRVVAGGRES